MAQNALDYFLHALGALFRMRRIYASGSKQVIQSARQASQKLAEWKRPVRITFLGNDTIVEDRRIENLPGSFRALFQSIQQLGFESVQIEADAGEGDLTAWIENVVARGRPPYRSVRIVAGSLKLQRRSEPDSVVTQAVTGYMGFLAEAQEVLSDLESKKPEGLVRAREVVCAIVARLAVGRELFEPIREMKNFDDYTFTHALNVCVLSSALAQALQVSDEMVTAIAMAALCHDLGKKEVPKEVLNHNGPLAPEQWLLMQRHPSCGARLLLDIPGVESANPLLPVVAYQHHMGANQSGYPKVQTNLPQHTLHFASLLVAIADVYDALRTVRPYRPALSVAKTTTILIKDAQAGRLHREYVSRFLSLLNVLIPGRRVVLSDGSSGMIVETNAGYPLCPFVEDERGGVRDLSEPSAPTISEVGEESTGDLQ
ncbi:MAG TPA: HD domain-containing phosphohydrolase [Thermodesulfobacteriota bacterium]|nr:HD domain-containing phosphohydrolase [Thermodesulfobacteriota bacterium]